MLTREQVDRIYKDAQVGEMIALVDRDVEHVEDVLGLCATVRELRELVREAAGCAMCDECYRAEHMGLECPRRIREALR